MVLPARKPLKEATVADAEVLALLRRAGGVEGFFQEFEARPEQETMASAVNQAFTDQRHLVVEAGTGTGKSLAYQISAMSLRMVMLLGFLFRTSCNNPSPFSYCPA